MHAGWHGVESGDEGGDAEEGTQHLLQGAVRLPLGGDHPHTFARWHSRGCTLKGTVRLASCTQKHTCLSVRCRVPLKEVCSSKMETR